MHNTLMAASTLWSLAAAAPQAIPFHAVDALPLPSILGPDPGAPSSLPVPYDPQAMAKSAADAITAGLPAISSLTGNLKKRDGGNCSPEPLGYGPTPSPDTDTAFLADPYFANAANNAQTPSGYKLSFQNLQAATQEIGYLTYRTLNSYDPIACAAACDQNQWCNGFNIYFERDPTLDAGSACLNPLSTTNIKCALFGYPVSNYTATNAGQYRQDFHVVIAGSNGYSKEDCCRPPPTVPDFNAPVSLPGAINDPDASSYITYKVYNEGPYDPSVCRAACEAQTAYNKQHPDANGNYAACNFFNSYILLKNGAPQGFYCSLYTKSFSAQYATNTGSTQGSDVYTVECSAGYTLTNQDPGHV